MFALLALPFKLVGLLLGTVLAVLRSLLGLAFLLLNPFVLILVALVVAAVYFL